MQPRAKRRGHGRGLPNRVFSGKVALVYPQMDAATRTNRVRFAVANAGGELAARHVCHRPHQRRRWAKSSRCKSAAGQGRDGAAAAADGGQPVQGEEVLTVPERAVIDTGAKQIVYVEREPGLFDGVEVQLGPRSGEFYPVLQGLEAGRSRGGGRGVPHRRRDAIESGRRGHLLRRQRRAAVAAHARRSHRGGTTCDSPHAGPSRQASTEDGLQD